MQVCKLHERGASPCTSGAYLPGSRTARGGTADQRTSYAHHPFQPSSEVFTIGYCKLLFGCGKGLCLPGIHVGHVGG